MNRTGIVMGIAAVFSVLAAGCRREVIPPAQGNVTNTKKTTNFPIFVEEWVEQSNFPSAALRRYAIGFSIGAKGYMGGGEGLLTRERPINPNNYSTLNDFWEYDPAGNTWTQKANLPVPLERAATFVIGAEGYVCTGYSFNNSGFNLYNQLYQYDQASNTWNQKASFPGAIRCDAVGTSMLNEGYVGTGGNFSSPFFSDWWQYDPPTDHWTREADLPGTWGRAQASSFSIGPYGFITCGNVWATTSFANDLWMYVPGFNAWEQMPSLPASGRAYASGFNYGSYGAVTCGYGSNGYLNDFWYYDFNSNVWTSGPGMGGAARFGAVGFAINGTPYVGTGSTSTNLFTDDFWYLTYVVL